MSELVQEIREDRAESAPGYPIFMVTAVEGTDWSAEAELKKELVHYWSGRAAGFSELHERELKSSKRERWLSEIEGDLPRGRKARKNFHILDPGCGSGFFPILLAGQGCSVTGVDLTPAMIEQARGNARTEGVDVRFEVGDAEHPGFPEESFDMIVTRNLTWCLPNLETAYKSWFRLLKKGGVLLNFDANYVAEDVENEVNLPPEHAHNTLTREQVDECHDICSRLDPRRRPENDMKILRNIGFTDISVDKSLSSRIFREIDEFYNPVRMFRIRAVKG